MPDDLDKPEPSDPDDDQTGDPWPGCICNDCRYDIGHMESCPWFGAPPDIGPDIGPDAED